MICKKCSIEFKRKQIIDGEIRNLQSRKYCLACSPFDQHNTKKLDKKAWPYSSTRCVSYTNQEFEAAIKASISVRQVLIKLGLGETGDNYAMVKIKAKQLNLDVSHFKGKGANKGRVFPSRIPIEKYLSNTKRISSHELRLRLLKDGLFEHKCCKCNNTTWNDQPIPLELDHIDGNHRNNNISNLTILCPNCHAQTPTYCGKNIKKRK